LMGIIDDIIFAETGPPSLSTVVFVKFDLYKGPSITTPEGTMLYLSFLLNACGKVSPESCVLDFRFPCVLRGQ